MKLGYAVAKQLMLAIAASVGYLTIGLVRGFSSPGVPSMQALSPHLVPDEEAISWISAIPPCGAFVGSLVAGPLLQFIGRKRSLMINLPLFASGWVLIAYAPNTQVLLVARIITGFCVGIVMPSAQVYVSECSHPDIRGILGSLPALSMAIGVLISYVLGAWLTWNRLALACALFPTVLIFILIPLPESPVWLRRNNMIKEADEALAWLHHKPQPTTDELAMKPVESHQSEAITAVEAETEATTSVVDTAKSAYSQEALLRRPVLIPFGLAVTILVFQQVSGIDTIIFYTVSIFRSSSSSLGDYEATITVGFVQVVATILSLFLIDCSGRKPLLIASGLCMAVSMFALGTYFHLLSLGRAGSLGLLPVTSLIIFMIGYSIGYCNIPFILMGEILPVAQRSLLSSIAGSINLGSMFLVIKTYPNIKHIIGSQGAFWIYGVFCALSCVFVMLFLPETKGKSLDEIEKYFENTQCTQSSAKSNCENNIVIK